MFSNPNLSLLFIFNVDTFSIWHNFDILSVTYLQTFFLSSSVWILIIWDKSSTSFSFPTRIDLVSFDGPGCWFSFFGNLICSGYSLGPCTIDSSGGSIESSFATITNFVFLGLPTGIKILIAFKTVSFLLFIPSNLSFSIRGFNLIENKT